jgi:hypothetical protein
VADLEAREKTLKSEQEKLDKERKEVENMRLKYDEQEKTHIAEMGEK